MAPPNRPRFLVVDTMHPSLIGMLGNRGITAEYQPDIRRPQILAAIGDYEGIIIRSKTVLNAEFFDHARQLRYIARAGAGLEGIDLEQARARQVAILNAPEGNRDAVAEHTVGLILALLNHMVQAHGEIQAGLWRREANRGTELGAQTVGLIGYGHMGQAVAKRLTSFGCPIIAYDKYAPAPAGDIVKAVSLDELQERSTVISLHIPLTAETRGMIDARFLRECTHPIWLINTARGPIVSSLDLLYGLRAGRVAGAALDVLENERLDQLLTPERVILQSLLTSGRVIVTPHVAGWTHQSYVKINKVLVDKIVGATGLHVEDQR